jgi:hypothetical protein
MVDVVATSGQAYEYHDGTGLVALAKNVASARAGQGVSYVLFTSGLLKEYNEYTNAWTTISRNIVAIDAGTDPYGVSAVDMVDGSGNAWEFSDTTGWHFIASAVSSMSAGQHGTVAFVAGTGDAYLFSEKTGAATFLDSNASQVTAGVDAAGNAMIDLLFANGDLYEYQAANGWTHMNSGVQSVGKGRAGIVDLVLAGGNACEHNAAGAWSRLLSGAFSAV